MSEQENIKEEPYRVLARKYRPQSFAELIGQDALVRTLQNAISSGRIAHAFMLTGVRGVGKTTTARIIAKALNYTGADGTAGSTTGSTEDCELCQAISEDRHPDVIEMDAASRTGIDDIREILDGVRYAPTQARYKIYIIDEVHMLSKQAFNALLKTLEEPPDHVKFIFATTEIRKVPITVLSRCQRFDLRRVDAETLIPHFTKITKAENVEAEDEAISLIARAADGSVRDGLSLLDQAIAQGDSKISVDLVQDMLGLADRAKNMDLLENALMGDMPAALAMMDDLYRAGADPAVMLQDLLDITHMLTRFRAVPDAKDMKQALSPDMVARVDALAQKLSMPTLGKTWQVLLKGLGEVNIAPNPQIAAEMVLIRLVYAADLPDPADLMKKLKDMDASGVSAPVAPIATASAAPAPAASPVASQAPVAPQVQNAPPPITDSAPVAMLQGSASGENTLSMPAPMPEPEPVSVPVVDMSAEKTINNLEDVVSALEGGDEFRLAGDVFQFVHLVRFKEGHLEIRSKDNAPARLAQDLSSKLSAIVGKRWMVSVSGESGAPTLAQQSLAASEAELQEVLKHPLVSNVLELFPEAQVIKIHNDVKTDTAKMEEEDDLL